MAAPERDVITTPVPTVALLAAARAMTQPEPPADLGLERAVRESRIPPAPGSTSVGGAAAGDERASEPPPSSERRALPPGQARGARPGDGQMLPSEPFEFELSPRSARGAAAGSHAAPPLAEELGLDHLLADCKPQRSGWQWLRAHGVWVVLAVLVLWLIGSFAVRWLAR